MIEAAGEEFERAGYSGATTAAIARRAQVTETQIFRYFGSKEALFRAAIFHPLNSHFSAFHVEGVGDVAAAPATRERAERYIVELQKFLAAHSRMLMSLAVARAYDLRACEEPGPIPGLEVYFERGAAMMRAGISGERVPVPPELLVRVSFAAVLGCTLFQDWLFPSGVADDTRVRRAVIDFVLDGMNANAWVDLRFARPEGAS